LQLLNPWCESYCEFYLIIIYPNEWFKNKKIHIFFWLTIVSMQIIGNVWSVVELFRKGKIAADIPVMHILCASIGLWIEMPWLNHQSSKNSDRVWNTFAITIARHRHRQVYNRESNEISEYWNETRCGINIPREELQLLGL